MPLPLPVLDDRTYEQLLEEIRERLPATAPQWTDHNVSDPGITLLELFAYLNESLLYRFDRNPESQYRAFLRLMGCAPRPAQVARAAVAFRATQPAGAVDLPAGVQVASAGGDTVFQTGTPFHVSAARLTAVITSASGRFEDRSRANTSLAEPFLAFGEDPQPGDALYLGFDHPPGNEGECLRLFVIGEEPAADLRTWQALRDEWRREVTRFRGSCPRLARGAARFWQHYGARVAWEYYDGHDWITLPSLKDGTRALSLSGPVRWRSPGAAAHRQGGLAGYDSTYFIRCRLVEGGYDCAPRIRGVLMNAAIARHAADVADAFPLGTSTGRAAQHFRLPQTPAVPGSTRLAVAINGIPRPGWTEQPDFDRSGPHAKHYVLAPMSGDIAFGNGRKGRVPDAGAELSVFWKVGGGAQGNVASGTLGTLPAGGTNSRIAGWSAIRDALAVEQPIDACGGANAEPIDTAKARAYRTIAEERCATTLADLERIALAVPGVPVARAHAVAEFHPELSCLPAAGCVTLVIVPRCVGRNPHPTDALCRAVARYVSRRRPLALEVHVTGPEYTVVSAHARLALARGTDRASVTAQAAAALRAFLDPLAGGPEGSGWPVGRAVYRSEILALLDAVAGVQYVAELTLTVDGESPAHCGDITICPNGLVTSGAHRFSAI